MRLDRYAGACTVVVSKCNLRVFMLVYIGLERDVL